MPDDDKVVFQDQVQTIREWASATVGIMLALYEPNLFPDEYDSRCKQIGQLIFERVVGNKGNSKKIVIYDDATLKLMYKRIVEATLRWASEKVYE